MYTFSLFEYENLIAKAKKQRTCFANWGVLPILKIKKQLI